jgi:hypothetical protein
MYGFTLMPPMPPRPQDTARRAEAVRRVVRLAKAGVPAVGLAPEGMDSPDGKLMRPPPGAGRLVAHIAGAGYTLLPVGVYEEGDAFCLRFGEPFALPETATGSTDAIDREVSTRVMQSIAALLPERLRGAFS